MSKYEKTEHFVERKKIIYHFDACFIYFAHDNLDFKTKEKNLNCLYRCFGS